MDDFLAYVIRRKDETLLAYLGNKGHPGHAVDGIALAIGRNNPGQAYPTASLPNANLAKAAKLCPSQEGGQAVADMTGLCNYIMMCDRFASPDVSLEDKRAALRNPQRDSLEAIMQKYGICVAKMEQVDSGETYTVSSLPRGEKHFLLSYDSKAGIFQLHQVQRRARNGAPKVSLEGFEIEPPDPVVQAGSLVSPGDEQIIYAAETQEGVRLTPEEIPSGIGLEDGVAADMHSHGTPEDSGLTGIVEDKEMPDQSGALPMVPAMNKRNPGPAPAWQEPEWEWRLSNEVNTKLYYCAGFTLGFGVGMLGSAGMAAAYLQIYPDVMIKPFMSLMLTEGLVVGNLLLEIILTLSSMIYDQEHGRSTNLPKAVAAGAGVGIVLGTYLSLMAR